VALAHQQEVAAMVGLVHDVARNEQCCSAPGELVELLPQVDAQHGVKTDGGFIKHQQFGM
jgi:hypothetical protein